MNNQTIFGFFSVLRNILFRCHTLLKEIFNETQIGEECE